MCAMGNQVTQHMNSNDKMLNTVIVYIPSLAQAKFCFTAIGKTPSFTIAVEGTFTTSNSCYASQSYTLDITVTFDNIDTGSSGTTVILIAVISVISSVIIILLLGFIAGLSRIISKKKDVTLKQHEYTDQDE